MNFFENLARKVTDAYSFSEKTRWIHASGAARLSHHLFRRAFSLNRVPERAVMLVMAAQYAEVYLNGKAVASVSERSYIFDKSYEVFDVTPYLVAGKNAVAVIEIETGEPIRTGFALEIQADGEPVLISDNTWRTISEESTSVGVDFLLGGGEEHVDAAKRTQNFADINFDDSAWTPCEVIGDELLHAPFERFHQSKTREQTAGWHTPVAFSAVMRAGTPRGYSLRLGPSNTGVTLAMAMLSLNAETELMFVTYSDIRGIAIDGREVEQNRPFRLAGGTHFLMIAFAWTVDFFIRTDAALSFAAPDGGEGEFAGYLIPVPEVRYPWNEFRGRKPSDDLVDELLKTPAFDALPEEMQGAVLPLDFGTPDSVLHEIITRAYSVPENGFAEERIFRDMRIVRGGEPVAFENRDSLLGEDGHAVIPPQDGILYFILDFGTEQVGRVAFTLDAPAGTVVEAHSFEMIADSGIKYMGGAQTMRYLCREGMQSFVSRRRRGFRYLAVSVYGNSRPVTVEKIGVIETRYPTAATSFSCSDASLCKIYEMSARTAELCMLDLYVDCPGYEQNSWTGDARVTGLVNLHNFGAFEFDANYLRLIAESVEDGLRRVYRTNNPRYLAGMYLPCACFPTYPEGCIPIWSFMWFLQVCDHYDCTGDIALLSDVFYAVREMFSRCEKMTDARGLFDMQGAWNLIEWANNDLAFYGEVTANNVMLSYCFGKAASLAETLGDTVLAAYYREQCGRYRDAVNRYCWDKKKRAYVDTVRDEFAYNRYCAYMDARGMEKMSYETFLSEGRVSVHTNTMAILYDCVPKERLDDAKRFLVDNLESGLYVAGTPAARTAGEPSEEEAPGGYVHIGSPFFLFFALSAAYKLGLDDLALTCQRRDWGSFLESGLTTCIENFKRGDEWTRSVAHAWSASPAVFLISEVLGVKPIKPGYREFSVTPKTAGLDFARGSVPTPYGPIHVEWKKRADGTVEVLCDAPAECERV